MSLRKPANLLMVIVCESTVEVNKDDVVAADIRVFAEEYDGLGWYFYDH